MTTMDVESTFVDTNILIYADVPAAPECQAARRILEDLTSQGIEIWISRQVLREYMAFMTRSQTLMKPVPREKVATDIRRWSSQFKIAEDGSLVTERLLASFSIGGKQVHDANIVATMLAHGINRLVTHNVADFRRFATWIEVIPLV